MSSLRSVIIFQIIVCVFSKSLSLNDTVNNNTNDDQSKSFIKYTKYLHNKFISFELAQFKREKNSIFRIPLTKIHRSNHRHVDEKTNSRKRRSPFFGKSLFDDMFGMNDDIFDPLKIFDHAFDDDDFGFNIPFKFPPMEPLWPFHFPHRKFHKPGRGGVVGNNGFNGNHIPWIDNLIPDNDKNHPPSKVNGNRVYLRNFNDVNCILLRSNFCTFLM